MSASGGAAGHGEGAGVELPPTPATHPDASDAESADAESLEAEIAALRRRSGPHVRFNDGNAWTNRTEGLWVRLPALEKVKMAFFVLSGIALVRIVAVLVLTVLLSIWMLVVLAGHVATRVDGSPAPLPRWRRALLVPVSWACRAILWLLGYWWIEETWEEEGEVRGGCCGFSLDVADRPRVVVANHVSFVDTLLMGSKFIPVAVTNAATTRYPLLGPAIAALGPILVPRTAEERARLPPVADQLRDRPRSPDAALFPPILIFPEGTTTNQDYLLDFQRGAFLAGVPVQPVCLSYPFAHADATWSADAGTLWLFFRLCCQFVNRLQVRYLRPVVPDARMKAHPELFAAVTRALMADALGVCTLQFSDHDTAVINRVTQRHGRALVRYTLRHLMRAHEEIDNPVASTPDDPIPISAHAHAQAHVHPASSSPSSVGHLRRMPSDLAMPARRAEALAHLDVHSVCALVECFADADDDQDGALSLENLRHILHANLPALEHVASHLFCAALDDPAAAHSARLLDFPAVVAFLGRLAHPTDHSAALHVAQLAIFGPPTTDATSPTAADAAAPTADAGAAPATAAATDAGPLPDIPRAKLAQALPALTDEVLAAAHVADPVPAAELRDPTNPALRRVLADAALQAIRTAFGVRPRRRGS
jgi:lysophosphatidylcholine acyltransferase/lyso-PAF acetyltransferase